MKSIRLILIFALLNSLLFVTSLQAQSLDSLEAELAYYSDAMTNMSTSAHRARSAEMLHHKILEALSIEGSFTHQFKSLEWCKIISPRDTTFKLITWQLEMDDNTYRYYGVIQKSDGRIIELHDKRPLRSEYASHDQNTWYGALYYGIEEFKNIEGQNAYLILGFSISSASTNQKVADVLQFVDDGVHFGAEVFVMKDEDGAEDVKSRILLEYAATASGRMQFDREKKMLIYDHVILINAGFDGPLWVPDGSFHGFEYKDGNWHFVDKVFQQTVNQPPGEGIESNQRDIIGRKKN
ncbi:MAG: hypothetical protein DRI69_02725 [Bacteroidetes bacterium]|nr:MAG: hypothetical protein DRI69_02725 [Bacteroidota bacterium]